MIFRWSYCEFLEEETFIEPVKVCMICEKEVGIETNKCKCRSKYFIVGNKGTFILDKENLKCQCGNYNFILEKHSDCRDRVINHKKCSCCGTKIEVHMHIVKKRRNHKCFFEKMLGKFKFIH